MKREPIALQDTLFTAPFAVRTGPERHLVLAGERIAKEIGQARAIAAASMTYKQHFDNAIDYLCNANLAMGVPFGKTTFTIDDVIDLIGLPAKGQNKNNAVGALMAGASKRGLIRAVGYTESTRAGSHGRAVRLWKKASE